MIYEVKRGNTVLAAVHAQGVQDVSVMEKDRVEMRFRLPVHVDFKRGDTTTVFGQTYKINRKPSVNRSHDKLGFDYVIEFEARYYDLAKWQFKGLDATNQLTVSEVYLTGTAATVIELIVRNANRMDSGWEIGVVDETEAQRFTFVNQSLLTVLTELATTFESEYWVDGKVIHFQKREASTGVSVEFGKGKGLYRLTRGVTETSIINRLYVEGAARNLPSGYGFSRLQLPLADRPYLQAPIAPGEEIVEHSIFFDNIFPSRTGTVTALGATELEFVDDTLDFDINDHLTGTPAKVSFVSGQLASFEFEITEYVHATKTITIKRIDDDPAYPDGIPHPPLVFAVGDRYVLLDIDMPDTYRIDAENRLKAAGQSYLDENKEDRHEYQADLTPIWVLQQSPNLRLGYTINIKDAELGIDKDLRIAGWQRDLQQPAQYTGLKLAERIRPSEIARQYAQQERILYAIQTAGLLDPDVMRKNLFLNRLSERDGYLYLGPDKAKSGYADLAARAYNADVADYALDSDKWDGFQFADYMNQPVRSGDSPRFAGTGSPLFVSGFSGSGWRVVNENGSVHATFDKLTVRKEMNVYELVINQIRATNGSVWISDAIKIFSVSVSGSNYICSIDTDGNTIGVPFVVNDIIRCQRWTGRNVKYYVARVTAIGSGTFTVVKLDGGGVPESGDDVVRMGNSTNVNRRGALYLTASDDNAPYIDVIDGVTSASLEGKTKVRMGKLTGIVDPDMGALSGYGLYAQNAYITGRIQVTGGNAATQTYAASQASAAQAAAIAAAATDATTKANNARTQAVSTASGDATTKANAAQAAAIAAAQTYADSVATSKANVAQAAAIQAASNDATTKANNARQQAEQLAQQLVDSVAVGGVNLVINTSSDFRSVTWSSWNYYVNGNNYYVQVEAGEPYTLNVYYRSVAGNGATVRIFWYNSSNQRTESDNGTIVPIGGEGWATLTLIAPAGSVRAQIILRCGGASGGSAQYKELKFEQGNKATGWSPATADVQAAISAADAAAQAAQTAYNNLTAALKGMAYKDIVQLADMGTTLISGGKIVTTLLDAAYIRANIVNAGYINTLALDASVITSGTINSARINASQIITVGGGATTTYAQQQASAAQSAAIAAAATDATTKANNARTQAVSTAASDATAKANDALALARSFTDDKVNLVKNPAVTGSITGWSGSGLAVANQSFNGLSTPVLRCTSTSSAIVYSEWFDVDPAKIYEVTIWMYAPTAGGNKYFGVHACSTAGGTANNIAVEPIADSGGAVQSDSTNAYFWNTGSTIASWRKMTAYILPSGFNAADAAGIGLNVVRHMRMKPTTKRIRLRWLNYDNGGTSRQVFVAHPTVTEISSQSVAFAQSVKSAAATADSKAVAAQAAYNNLTAALKGMAYKDVVALADLNTTVIQNGKIVTTLLDAAWIRANVITAGSIKAIDIDVTNLFSQSINATNLTVTGSSKVGGFSISGNSLVNASVNTSMIFNNLSSSANSFLRMNASSSSPIIQIRSDQTSRNALMIETYAAGATGIRIINNASAGTGRAIQSAGSHEFMQRAGEIWNAPGAILAATVSGSGSFIDAWHISSITPTIGTVSGGIVRLTHGLGHTDYVVMVVGNGGYVAVTKTINYCDFGLGTGNTGVVAIFGRNRV